MKKILIIGQAPPAVKQQVPYDTTMLYEMLSWVGIDKAAAQTLFEFEAVSDVFPGHGTNGHKLPTKDQMIDHYNSTLKQKIKDAEKIIVLGAVASDFLFYVRAFSEKKNESALLLIHPSKRNYARIIQSKESITASLKKYLDQ